MVSKECKDMVEDKVLECLSVMEDQGYGVNLPTILYNLKGRIGGQACYGRNTIRLNVDFLNHYKQEFVDDVVPHELAHLIADKLYGTHIKSHGREWKKTCVMIGGNTSRTHNYDLAVTTVRRQQRYEYKCGCCTHILSTTRHRKIMRGRANYSCSICKGKLQYVGLG